jgi:hypothetical protein
MGRPAPMDSAVVLLVLRRVRFHLHAGGLGCDIPTANRKVARWFCDLPKRHR